MNYEIIDCIDAGTQFCPCHLAESNECILCSQLQGKSFCDCKNWRGTCIYQEFNWNNNIATSERESSEGLIISKEIIYQDLIKLVIKTNHHLCKELVNAGSYVFLRCPESSPYFDVPISIMDCDIQKDTISMIIEIEGIKTKKVNELNEKDTIMIKGPFWNGVFGLKNIQRCTNKNVLLIARGIGQAPIVPVLKQLYKQNTIWLVIDKGRYEDVIIKEYINKYPCNIVELKTIEEGKLTQDLSSLIDDYIEDNFIEHVHCSGPDILIQELITKVNNRTATSCCNNAKVCCGQGVCGACTTRFEGHVVKRLCKLQTDPEYIFEGRRQI
ncbi:sulfide/dihydroorotate dehydrogenase-like FAD/NAD-binding protein [Alkalibaculum sp. M08DMB]|uniref:Sulfide/dihydroorotate dehydrogenase-like FAD/NAD-binding protein n=1 Tax=Alkalibaculum sporogenes TaxID=2655001 RepID=A0A6A7KD43_9FIRM|nr:sulfide/dihydroorotate dehydrogenase-like FAD/NAD-binding protein [Alkalibaculum sporogenes]MPW26923.1 sulfide/dihydroorotate dehydrogenase-like FAD/NAD-binding protein [Alkalibaculum sporogenes]